MWTFVWPLFTHVALFCSRLCLSLCTYAVRIVIFSTLYAETKWNRLSKHEEILWFKIGWNHFLIYIFSICDSCLSHFFLLLLMEHMCVCECVCVKYSNDDTMYVKSRSCFVRNHFLLRIFLFQILKDNV